MVGVTGFVVSTVIVLVIGVESLPAVSVEITVNVFVPSVCTGSVIV